MQTSFHRYLEVSETRSQGNQVHARFKRTWNSSSKASEKRPRRRRIQQGKIQRDLRGANRFRGDFWAAVGITAVGDRFKAGMFFGKWNDMKWDVILWYWCNDKTWKSWLIQYSSSNLSGWKWTGKPLQEKKQRLLALAKQKREEVAATAKSRLRIWVCFWNPLFFVTLDRKDVIFSGSASRAFCFNLRRLIQWPLVPRKNSGFRKSSSKVKATRRFWRFFLAILWTRSTFLMSWIGFFRIPTSWRTTWSPPENRRHFGTSTFFSSWCRCDELEVAGSLLIRNELTIRMSTGRSAKSNQ